MTAFVTAGAGFLVAVLWFDLMFDSQVRGQGQAELPVDVRYSIAAYYRRVTTEARPGGRLVAAVMLITIAALAGEVARGQVDAWIGWTSLVLASFGVGLAAARTVRQAVRLGTQEDGPEHQSELARAIFFDHCVCFAALTAVVVLQLLPR